MPIKGNVDLDCKMFSLAGERVEGFPHPTDFK
jgi:hypothetical protein